MRMYFTLSKQEQMKMSCFFCKGWDSLDAIFAHMPEKIIRHSKRVSSLAGILSKYVPKEQLPRGMDRDSYRSVLLNGAYYHDIGVYLARNEIHDRPAAAVRLLTECRFKDMLSDYSEAVLETVRYCHNWYIKNKQPDLEDIPLHASICAIADAVDMFMVGIILNGRKSENAVKYICQNSDILFNSDATDCFEQAKEEVFDLYAREPETVTV